MKKKESQSKLAGRFKGSNNTSLFILLFIILLGAVLSIVSENFLTAYNIGVIVRQMSFVGMAALAQTLVLITIGTDLSVGTTACLANILFAIFATSGGMPAPIAIVLSLVICMIIGLCSGMLITKLKLSPFIVTLGISEISTGAVLVITQGVTVTGLEGPVLQLGAGMLGPVPVPTLIFIGFALIMAYVMKYTPFGREIYAIGGNANAARLVGIKVDRNTCMVFSISAALAAIGGILMACRYSSGQPNIGETWRMNSITAAVVGGTSMTGGSGSMLGTVIGALLITQLSNAIVILNISQYWEKVVTGGVVLLAVAIDALRSRAAQAAK